MLLCTLITRAIFLPVIFTHLTGGKSRYCTDTTNPAMGIAESGDRRPADPVVTGDRRVWSQVPVVLVVTGKSAGNFLGDWEKCRPFSG